MRTETTGKWLQRNSPFVLVTVGFIKQIFLSKEWKSCLLLWGVQSCTPCAAGCVPRSCFPGAGGVCLRALGWTLYLRGVPLWGDVLLYSCWGKMFCPSNKELSPASAKWISVFLLGQNACPTNKEQSPASAKWISAAFQHESPSRGCSHSHQLHIQHLHLLLSAWLAGDVFTQQYFWASSSLSLQHKPNP